MLWAGSPKQRDIDHVEPAQNAVDDRPEDRVVVGIGDRDGERGAETHAVFRALDPNPVVSVSVHGDPSGAQDGEVGRFSVARHSCRGLQEATASRMASMEPMAADYATLIRPTDCLLAGTM